MMDDGPRDGYKDLAIAAVVAALQDYGRVYKPQKARKNESEEQREMREKLEPGRLLTFESEKRETAEWLLSTGVEWLRLCGFNYGLTDMGQILSVPLTPERLCSLRQLMQEQRREYAL